MEIHILASGSDGNSTLVKSGNSCILIDAGFGPRNLRQRLTRIGISATELQACFLTHEHRDHVIGLGFRGYPQIPIYANTLTRDACVEQYPNTERCNWQEIAVGGSARVGAFRVSSFAISHDAVCSVGYSITAQGQTMVYATDLGQSNRELIEAIGSADVVVLESNHDAEMLSSGPYPRFLKHRVRSRRGHLSNSQTAETLSSALTQRTRLVILAHLSRTNNRPCIALKTVSAKLEQRLGLHENLRLQTAPPLASKQTASF